MEFLYESLMPFFLLFTFYSILGWVSEVINGLIFTKKFVNRGFLIGPYCPIYGSGAILITLLFSKYSNNVLILFGMSALVCSIVEYITSYLMEKIFKVRWWDYSENRFNINGRVCLSYASLFGIGGVFIIKLINPFIMKYIYLLDNTALTIIFIVILVIMILDYIISITIINKFKKSVKIETKDATEIISLKVKEVFDEYQEKAIKNVGNKVEIVSNKIRNYIDNKSEQIKIKMSNKSFLYKRLVKAFPNSKIKLKKIKNDSIK